MDNQTAIKIEKSFTLFSDQLLGLGATYSSILIFNDNNLVIKSFSSDQEWADEFTSKELYKDCHLLQEAHKQMKLNQAAFTIAWDLYSPVTEKAKNLDDVRKQKNITHGVGFCIQYAGHPKILLNIAGKYADVNFGLNVLRNRGKIYQELREILMKNV